MRSAFRSLSDLSYRLARPGALDSKVGSASAKRCCESRTRVRSRSRKAVPRCGGPSSGERGSTAMSSDQAQRAGSVTSKSHARSPGTPVSENSMRHSAAKPPPSASNTNAAGRPVEAARGAERRDRLREGQVALAEALRLDLEQVEEVAVELVAHDDRDLPGAVVLEHEALLQRPGRDEQLAHRRERRRLRGRADVVLGVDDSGRVVAQARREQLRAHAR